MVLSESGNECTVHFFDRKGNPADGPQAGYVGEISETFPDGTVKRTYIDQTIAEDKLHLSDWGFAGDDEPSEEDQDWMKATAWDVHDPLSSALVTTVEMLLRANNVDWAPLKAQVQSVCHSMGLPSWDMAPVELKIEAYKWVTDNRAALG